MRGYIWALCHRMCMGQQGQQQEGHEGHLGYGLHQAVGRRTHSYALSQAFSWMCDRLMCRSRVAMLVALKPLCKAPKEVQRSNLQMAP